ncbi:hypothetical protein DFH07DRAFT_967958 [Mycena maculata]|uniref:Uncharacterized protein n=1 Tax=Mycena maculata TaxID=230809 RepID=A0AAD7MWD9_9AGAR|nr:hypothetical protein DFH07DRAFT_967958 [Mycena maculata]
MLPVEITNTTKAKDFASIDLQWGSKVENSFYTREEYFLEGFHVSPLPSLPLFTPSSSPLLPNPPTQEVVLFGGYPCVGKTTFFRQYFEPAGYIRVNRDPPNKCAKAVQEALAVAKSVVADNTNRDA